ncbi:MAG: alpha/beta fold hydrolase [Promethearchaeota archaeon]
MVESNKENQILKLKDDRKLGYAEGGKLDGKPVFHFHGTPGSRLEIKLLGEKPKEHGVHMIVVDRPGFGLSDFQPKRTLLDWPDDIIQLANHLRIDNFAVEGMSGGGPYAVACAYKIPERLTCCGIISGIGPYNFPKKGMMLWNRIGFFCGKWFPFLLKRFVKSEMKFFEDENALEKLAEMLPEPDRKFFKDPLLLEIFIEDGKEAYRSGLDGAFHENRIFSKPWDFNLDEISLDLQVYLWHGELDVNVPISMGKKMCELIPNCKGKFFPNEGHLSLGLNHIDEILETLKS